ncbi:MAG: Ferrichrome-iron receptor [Nitrospira sp.]|nr:MAG: Ferrichrome-iron receptor [Nitrospira sp.]
MSISSFSVSRCVSTRMTKERVASLAAIGRMLAGCLCLTVVTACIGPIKPVPPQNSEAPPPPSTETVEAPKPAEPAPTEAPVVPPVPLPLSPAEAPIPTEGDIPTLEMKPVQVTAQRESYKVAQATTATKTDTPIMETPFSVQVVPQQVLKDQQTTRLDHALNNVSGVFANQSFGLVESFTIRGFDTFDYYREGTRFQSALTQTGRREMANLERIEVLKGPASILYGRIQPGGMINLVTKKPLEESYYSIQQQVGSYDFYRTALDATSKLNESGSLRYRFNLSSENKGSFREFVDDKKLFIAPVVQWTVSERTQITFDGEYSKGTVRPEYGTVALGSRPASLPIERNLGESFAKATYEGLLAGFNWSHAFNSQWKIQHRAYVQSTKEDDQVVLPLALQADNETLDRFFAGFQGNKHRTYTTSLDLTGHFDTFGLTHRLLVGGDYYQFKNTGMIVDNFAFPSINIFTPSHSGSPLADPADDFAFKLKEKWFGLYLQDQVALPFHLHLLAGLRYDNAEITSDNTFGGVQTVLSSRQSAITPRVGLLWQPIKALALYGNYVEGFGVPNIGALGVTGAPLKAETSQQWEAGIKTEFFEGRWMATLSWFELTKQNIATGHPDPALAALGFSVQTGEARNKGIELDLTGEVLPGLDVIATYAYTDSEITKMNDSTVGHRFPNVPKHAGSVWATYRFQEPGLKGWKMGAGVLARGAREGNLENDYQMPGYALVNLMTSYAMRVGPTRLTAQLNVDNVLGQEYFPSSTGFGRSRIDIGTPRFFMGSLKMEF